MPIRWYFFVECQTNAAFALVDEPLYVLSLAFLTKTHCEQDVPDKFHYPPPLKFVLGYKKICESFFCHKNA